MTNCTIDDEPLAKIKSETDIRPPDGLRTINQAAPALTDRPDPIHDDKNPSACAQSPQKNGSWRASGWARLSKWVITPRKLRSAMRRTSQAKHRRARAGQRKQSREHTAVSLLPSAQTAEAERCVLTCEVLPRTLKDRPWALGA